MSRGRARRGVALLLALVTLTLLALLVAIVTRAATADHARVRDRAIARRAAAVAEGAWAGLVARWPLLADAHPGTERLLTTDTLRWPDATAVVQLFAATPWTRWIVAEGRAGDSARGTLAVRTVRYAARLARPARAPDAALSVADSVRLSDRALAVGDDPSVPGGAPCAGGAGLQLPDSARLCDGGCGAARSGGRVRGAPPVLVGMAPPVRPDSQPFGFATWAALARRAHVVLPPGARVTPRPRVGAAGCDRTVPDNWGDPTGLGPCAGYAPLVWARGDLELAGGAGQGILLVDGDLRLSSGARFEGLVVVRDDLDTGPGDGTLVGAVIAADERRGPGDYTALAGDARLVFSRCAVERAMLGGAPLVPLPHRTWSAWR